MLNVIISGGGTGGHIFPAIAIANALKEKYNGVKNKWMDEIYDSLFDYSLRFKV